MPHFNRKRELFVEFTDEKIVTESLSHFHNSNYCCINLILTILVDSLLCSLLLLRLQRINSSFKIPLLKYYTFVLKSYSFFHLNLIDLDSEEFICEFVVELKSVTILNFSPFGNLRDHPCFTTR